MFWRQLGTWLLNFRNINLIKFCFFIFCNRFQFTNCVRLKTNNWHLSLFFSFIVLNLNYGIQLICFFTYYDLSFILVVDILDLFIYFWNFFQVTCNFLSALSSFPALVFLGGILFLFLRYFIRIEIEIISFFLFILFVLKKRCLIVLFWNSSNFGITFWIFFFLLFL